MPHDQTEDDHQWQDADDWYHNRKDQQEIDHAEKLNPRSPAAEPNRVRGDTASDHCVAHVFIR
jgi:hypothetical protein